MGDRGGGYLGGVDGVADRGVPGERRCEAGLFTFIFIFMFVFITKYLPIGGGGWGGRGGAHNTQTL